MPARSDHFPDGIHGQICGKNYETLLHDVFAPECSAIAACNEHLSGCRIGNPVAELVKELRNSEPAVYHYMRRIRNETA